MKQTPEVKAILNEIDRRILECEDKISQTDWASYSRHCLGMELSAIKSLRNFITKK